jgi:uncharacterized protein (DUF433 family)
MNWSETDGEGDAEMTTIEANQIYSELVWLRQAVESLTHRVESLTAGREQPTLATDHAHIVRMQGVKGGEPIVRGKGVTVQTIAALTRQGLSPEQIVEEYEGVLTQAEVYEALGYFYDHVGEIEQYLAENRSARERTWPNRSS